MHNIGIDLGGTKLAAAIFNKAGNIIQKKSFLIADLSGKKVSNLIIKVVHQLLQYAEENHIQINGIGISVPGIYYAESGRVWAPNIKGWENFPLLDELQSQSELSGINIKIDSDRACYILGETWLGFAKGCKNAIFIAVGTGIGAGILIDGKILRGTGDIAGAVGWLGIQKEFDEKFKSCGYFEYYASGDGIARSALEIMRKEKKYKGELINIPEEILSSYNIFDAYIKNDPIAIKVFKNAIKLWGITIANLISIFNPEIIILGGGLFGPAAQFINQIKEETFKWAQPISIKQVDITVSKIGNDAGLIGAGRLAFLEN